MVDTSKLPRSMREAIILRKELPESSLNEISAMSIQVINKKISKSALNHRYRNINDLAEQILDDLNE